MKASVAEKQGYTDASGNTLVTYCKRGNITLVAVILNSTSADKCLQRYRFFFSIIGFSKILEKGGYEGVHGASPV